MQTERTQLIDDIGPRLFQFGRTGRSRAKLNLLTDKLKSLVAIKIGFCAAGGADVFTSVGLLGVLGQPSSSSENAKETIINIDREKCPRSCFNEVSFINIRRDNRPDRVSFFQRCEALALRAVAGLAVVFCSRFSRRQSAQMPIMRSRCSVS